MTTGEEMRQEAAFESWVVNAAAGDLEWVRELARQHALAIADVEQAEGERDKLLADVRELTAQLGAERKTSDARSATPRSHQPDKGIGLRADPQLGIDRKRRDR